MAADGYPPELAVGVTSTRIRGLSSAARAVHRVILCAFATTGAAPDPATLAGAAAGDDLEALLRELHERDVVRLDECGGIRAAYSFSAVPTAHRGGDRGRVDGVGDVRDRRPGHRRYAQPGRDDRFG